MYRRSWIVLLGFVCSFLSLTAAKAEYRAYLLKVEATQWVVPEPKIYLVASSLDAKQYTGFYGGKGVMKVEAVKSWMCPGYTGRYQDVCPDDEGQRYPRGAFESVQAN